MDFEFDDDQLGLRELAAEILAKECTPSLVRAVIEDDLDASGLWETLQRLDWPALTIESEFGGIEASAVELAIVTEQLGYVADPTPFLATTTQFVPLIKQCGDDEQRQRFLRGVASQAVCGTLAFYGPESSSVGPWDTESTATPTAIQASPTDEGWRLHGTAAHVVDGHRADQFVVLAGTASGIGAFVVPAEAVRVTRSPSLDPALPLSQIHFDDVIINESRRLRGANAAEGVADAFDEALVGMAMTTVGACQRSLDLVIEYVSGREQFGAPVGSFQAVKHKIVDVHVAIERARALGYFAAAAIAEGDERRGMAAAMAKAAAGEAERITVRHAIQLFGGIGFTWENDLHLYLRRAQACSLLFGTAVEHRARIGRHVLAAARATMGD